VLRRLVTRLLLPLDAVLILNASRNILFNVGIRIALLRLIGVEPITRLVLCPHQPVQSRGFLISRILAGRILRYLIFERKVQGCVLTGMLPTLVIVLLVRFFVQFLLDLLVVLNLKLLQIK
jgi:hypothetical protein